jgi:hypothetical protein
VNARRRASLSRFATALLLAVSAAGCSVDWDRVGEILSPEQGSTKKRRPDDPTGARPVDLGTACFPGSADKPEVLHRWSVTAVKPPQYELTYVLSHKANTDLESEYRGFARSVQFSRTDPHTFRWFPPPGCDRDMGCVFQALADEDRNAILPVVQLFRERQKEKELDALDLASLVVGFVQDIAYVEPDDEPFGLFAPALVVADRHGDCDSKSLLALMILNELGYDSVMLSSDAHRHAMLGIALPVPGTSITYKGRKYMFTELTAHAAPIGYLFPENAQPNDWRVVPLRRFASSP